MDEEVLISYLLAALSNANLPHNEEEEPQVLAMRLKTENPPQWRRFQTDYNIRFNPRTGRFYDLYEPMDASAWESTGLDEDLS